MGVPTVAGKCHPADAPTQHVEELRRRFDGVAQVGAADEALTQQYELTCGQGRAAVGTLDVGAQILVADASCANESAGLNRSAAHIGRLAPPLAKDLLRICPQLVDAPQ